MIVLTGIQSPSKNGPIRTSRCRTGGCARRGLWATTTAAHRLLRQRSAWLHYAGIFDVPRCPNILHLFSGSLSEKDVEHWQVNVVRLDLNSL